MVNSILFNVRVYGILMVDKKVLVTDEYHYGTYITKFPGGGLQFGEGTIDCLKREFREELDIDVEVMEHYYTTDFFQTSAFNDKQQVISIYYLVKPSKSFERKFSAKKFDFEKEEGAQSFRLVELNKDLRDEFTFPIDKQVGEMLANGS